MPFIMHPTISWLDFGEWCYHSSGCCTFQAVISSTLWSLNWWQDGDCCKEERRGKFKESAEDIRCFDEGSRSSWRVLNVYESSPASSEYSTESTMVSNVPSDKTKECDAEITALHQKTEHAPKAEKLDQHYLLEEYAMWQAQMK